MSAGYDSGAICCALNKLNIEYVTVTLGDHENSKILKKRIKINKLKGKGLTKCVKNIEKETKKKITSHKKDYNKCLRNVKKKTKQVNFSGSDICMLYALFRSPLF